MRQHSGKKRLGAVLLSLSLLPTAALAAEGDVTYLYYEDGEWKTGTKQANEYEVLSINCPPSLTAGWYVVDGRVNVGGSEAISLNGDVHLILADGCQFNATNGIQVDQNGSLTIYAQSTGDQMGKLIAQGNGIGGKYSAAGDITIHGGSVSATSGGGPGIGGESIDSITIHGGTVTATGDGTPGIGGKDAVGSITINGGTVTATSTATSAAGIGCGSHGTSIGTITITGGTVTANGGRNGAGIGSGSNYDTGTININIRGGTVTATGGKFGAGIGGAHESKGIINVTISGGTVTANGGTDRESPSYPTGDGIGGVEDRSGNFSGTFTFSTGMNGNAVILAKKGNSNDDSIRGDSGKDNWSGVIFEETTGAVYGSPTPTEDFTIPAGYTLTIPQGTTLTIPEGVTLTNKGSITVGEGGTLTNSGTILLDGGTIEGSVTGSQPCYPTSVDVNVSPSPTWGGTVTLTATVTGGSDTINSGTVTFYRGDAETGTALNNGGASVNNGTATHTIDKLDWTPGSYTITAKYSGVTSTSSGSIGLAESSKTFTLTVNKAAQDTAPGAPSGASAVTATSITLNAVTGSGQGGVEYGYTTGTEAEPGHWQTETIFDNLDPGTKYTFYARYAGNGNYEPSPASDGTQIYTAYAAPKEGEGYTINYTDETVTAKSGYEVKLPDDEKWTTSFINITPGDSFQVRHAADEDGAPASEGTTVTVAERPTAPTLTIDTEAEGVELSNEYYYNTTGVDYSNTWTQGTGSLVTVQPGSSIYIYQAATDSAFKSAVQTLTAPARASTPNAPTIDYEDEALTDTTTSMEYSTDSKTWTDCNADDMAVTAFGWDGTKEVSVQFRTAATDSNYASEAVSLAIPARPNAPAVTGGVERIQGATTAMEYQTGDGAWTRFNQATVGRLDPGTYTVRLAATDRAFASDPVTVEVTQYTPPANPNYRVDIPTPENGTITADPAAAKQGTEVTLTVTPEEGYEVGEVTVTDRFGEAVEVTANPDGTYTFTMPSGQVKVEVTFVESQPEPLPFTDVKEGDWFHDAVRYVYDNGLMDGVGDGQFAPNATTNRAMVVTILYRLAGEPAVSGDVGFTDVEPGLWYSNAVSWAAEKGIVNGISETEFSPGGDLTREQLATILFRYAEAQGYDVSAAADLSGYPDVDQIQSYAAQALSWAVAEGLVQGFEDDSLQPGGTATRAQIATILMRFCETVAE